MLKELIKLFIRTNGRNPNKLELLQLKFKAFQESGKGKILPFKYKRSFAEELADASKKGDFNRMQGIMKVDPKFKEVMKSFDEQKTAEALVKERAPKQTILEKIFYQTDEIPQDPIKKLKYSGLSEDQYKNVLKHGRTLDDVIYARDRSGMTIPQVMEAIEKKGPFPFAGGGIAGMLGEPTYQDDNHRVPLSWGGWLMKLLQGGSKAKPFNVKDFMDKREFILSLIGQGSKQKNKRILNEILEESGKIRKNPSFKFPDTDEIKKKIWEDITKDITKHAEGGRVPFKGGKKVVEGLAKLMDEFFPGTTKLGKRSKPYPEKVQEKMDLTKAHADFIEREKVAKIRETIKADEKAVAKLKKEHTEKYGEHIYDHRRSDEINKQSEALWKKIDDLQYKIDDNRYLVDDVVIDGKKYKLSDKDRPPTDDELETDYAELWNDEQSPWDFGSTRREMDAALAEAKDYERYMYQQYKMGKLDPEAGSVSRARLNLLRKRAEEAEDTKDFRLFGEDEADELAYLEDHFAQVDKEESFQFAERVRKAKEEARVNKKSPWFKDSKTLTPEEQLRREFPGISDDLIKNILADDNPQRIAEVKAAMKEALKMQQKGMGPDEIINMFKNKPTKHASGGLAGMLGE